MVEKIDGLQMLLTPEESDLFERQSQAQASGTVSKSDAGYQNDPKDGEQCSGCAMFVPGLDTDIAGYCTKVRSFRGPHGMIFEDGWCKFFEAAEEKSED
jgi:hypothetical protein